MFIAALSLVVAACSDSNEGASTTSSTGASSTSSSTTNSPLTPPFTTPPTTTTPRGQAGDDLTGRGTRDGLGDPWSPQLGNGGYDVDHYTLDLTFEPATRRLTAVTTIEAVALKDLGGFNLDFAGFEILELTVDDAEAGFARVGDELEIDPATTVAAGETFTTRITYEGIPAQTTSQAIAFGLGWRQSPQGIEYIVAEPDAAHSWFPSNDHPLDKATYTFRIMVPEGTVAAANGNHVDTITDLGFNTWVWEVTTPMASYLATLVIGDLEIVHDEVSTAEAGVPIRNVIPKAMADRIWPDLDRTGEMLRYLEEVFGPYPFDTYGIAVVDGFEGALENQTLSIFGDDVVFDIVLVHELAHQWFGNSVSLANWEDIWLNEGFATYAEWLWLEREAGRDFIDATLSNIRNSIAADGLPPPGRPPRDDLFNASVYIAGGLTLHALRLEIGDDAFFEVLRTYYDRFAGGTATTADFVAVSEEIADRELDDFFDAWLFGAELPQLPGI